MPDLPAALESIVCSFVPKARKDASLRDELLSLSQGILNSHIGHNHATDIGHLTDLVKRHLLQTSPTGTASLKFTNLLSRLLEQPALSRKHASILFLYSISSSPRHFTTVPSLLPSIVKPPTSRTAINSKGPSDPQPPARQKGKTKADILKDYRAKFSPRLPEHLLLRDALYLLQGISGKYVRFSPTDQPSDQVKLVFVDDLTFTVPPPTRVLIHRLSEVGHLYTRVDSFVKECENKKAASMILQSLCHHLQTQLTEYYRLIAVLESQMSMELSTNHSEDGQDNAADHDTGLTLRRLDVWINDWRLRMRMMSVCVEGARNAHGGALVNLIHGYTDNGDPFIRKFTDELLEEVSKPFFATLHKWLFSGELYDPFSEFFVAIDPDLARVQYVHPSALPGSVGQLSGDGGFAGSADADDAPGDREGGLRLWQDKYQFQKDMLPMFVGESFGRKIFSTGKSLNFIRYSCQDSEWVITRQKMSNTGGTLKYSDIAGLERFIDAAYQTASQRLFEVFLDKFKLLDHLQALKNYLMLGHGDFADQLMDILGPSLGKPANALYRHNLTATLETAIRSSNAQNDPPDVLRRLDARMLEYSHGEIGWDVFTLEYKVDAPLDTLLDPDSMVKYLKVFNHLWRLKRVEAALSKGWMRIAGATRTFLRLPDVESEWHQIRLVIAEMIHFIRQMRAYCQLEVIECSWKILIDFLHKKEGDLDTMIDAHRSYLDRIVKKVLLLSPKIGKEENLLNQVREVFTTILQFRESTDTFYNYCLSEAAYRDHKLDTARGVFTDVGESVSQAAALSRIHRGIKEYGTSFSERAQVVVQGLQSHPDLDCRFLGTMLSFSDFYKFKKEQQKS